MKSYTDISQSKKLAEILPLESADMHYLGTENDGYVPGVGHSDIMQEGYKQYYNYIPVWSLAALVSVLPDEVGDNLFLTLEKESNQYCCCYEDINGNSFKHTFADNSVDACYEMILKLHELNLL